MEYSAFPLSSFPIPRFDVNRIRFPSGETFGAPSLPPVVSRLGAFPSSGTIQMWPSYSSLSKRARCTEIAANVASGDKLGSESIE